MTVRVYASTDASAPALTQAAGGLIAVLDAILVTGYGAKTAAGWTKPYTGTNKAVFRTGGGHQRYLRIDDTNVSDYGARLIGYEAMTDVDTGTGLFPTTAQVSGGLWQHRAQNSTAGNRSWFCVATDKFVFFHNATNPTTPSNYRQQFMFGDIASTVSGDAYNTILIARGTGGHTSTDNQGNVIAPGSNIAGHYLARNYTQTGTAALFGKHTHPANPSNVGSGSLAYPNQSDGSAYFAPVYMHESVAGLFNIRGYIPGVYSSLHSLSAFADGDTFAGSGAFAGKTFRICKFGDSDNVGSFAVETSDTW